MSPTGKDILGGFGGAVYSCGTGQILGAPGIVISLITATIQGIASSVFSSMGDQKNAEKYSEAAKFSLKCAAGFALGMIPIVGGTIAYYVLIKEDEHPSKLILV